MANVEFTKKVSYTIEVNQKEYDHILIGLQDRRGYMTGDSRTEVSDLIRLLEENDEDDYS